MPAPVFEGLHPVDRPGEKSSTPFAVTCHCGAMLQGRRTAQLQIARCAKCGTDRFILPASPLPTVRLTGPESTSSLRLATSWRFWRWPLVAASVTLLMAVAGVFVVLNLLAPEHSDTPATSVDAPLAQELRTADAAIDSGNYHLAEKALATAIELEPRSSERWSAERRGQIVQQYRQAALVADLLAEAPAEIVRNSLGLPEAEWQAVFARSYAHRSIILDDTLHHDAAGFHLGYKMRVAGADIRWDLDRLTVLTNLRKQFFQPRRVLLGLRLGGIRREAKGEWLLAPEPDSGVLFTDARFFSGLSIAVDRQMEEVLAQQTEWAK
jgi:hypothetical protein